MCNYHTDNVRHIVSYYIEIPRINGRNDMARLSHRLYICGYKDSVEYCAGGWADSDLEVIRPHLKFEDEQDAVAYSLTYGVNVSKVPPGAN